MALHHHFSERRSVGVHHPQALGDLVGKLADSAVRLLVQQLKKAVGGG